ncbi:flagellar basal body-associated FliL family protein [Arenibaculum pallidiluteum]|uniref:flagellar basal body-associated FliL family protein n=1 Tax=Arenibaculum pallidiluteum TaxID=2812559 RepID=UPI001A975985|nr:flagellar basal body-associated FliL family protein [Arenibaculum pallidiluteum]
MGSADTTPGRAGRVLLALPLRRLVLAFVGTGLVVGAAVAGFRLSAGEGGLDRLLAPRTESAAVHAYVELPDMIVNLHPASRSRHLKIGITLATTEERRALLTQDQPKVVSALQEYLRGLDDTDMQGSAGLFRLRVEMRRRLALLLGENAVADVLIRSFLTQ